MAQTVFGPVGLNRAQVESAVDFRGLTVFNVRDPRFGAVGDGVTDDTQAIQAAIDATPQSGPYDQAIVYVPPGAYRITDTIDLSDRAGTRILGAGLPFWNSTGAGTVSNHGSKFIVDGAITAFLIDSGSPTSIHQEGVAFEYLGFEQDPPSARTATAVQIDRTNRWRFIRCMFKGFATAIRVDSHVTTDSPNNDNAWSHLEDVHFIANTRSLETVHTYGLTVVSGATISDDGDTGFYLANGESVRIIGHKFDGGIGIDYRSGSYAKIAFCIFERCTIGLRIGVEERHGWDDPSFNADSRFITVDGNAFAGSGSSDGAVQIDLQTHARSIVFVGNYMTNTQTKVNDVSHGGHLWLGHLSDGDLGLRLPDLGFLPPVGAAGEMIVNGGKLYIHNGTSWVVVGTQT